MSENLQKLVGVAVMAVLVVVGVVVSSGDDTDFTRNTAFATVDATRILVALTDIAETLEELAHSHELLSVKDAGGSNIESFANMITLLCVGDSTPLDDRSPIDQKIMRELDRRGAYYFSEDVSERGGYNLKVSTAMKFRKCVAGWILGLSPHKTEQLLTYFGYGWDYGDDADTWSERPCDPDTRRPTWGVVGVTPPYDEKFMLTTSETVRGLDVISEVTFPYVYPYDCADFTP